MITLLPSSESRQRLRLAPRVGSESPSSFPLWFPAVFLGIGLFAIGLTLKNPAPQRELFPLMFGMTFTVGGLVGMMASCLAIKPASNPTRPEQRDYPWELSGFTHIPFRSAFLSLGLWLVIALLIWTIGAEFLSHHQKITDALKNLTSEHRSWGEWWAMPGSVGALVLLFFNGLLLFIFGSAILSLIKSLRFGTTRMTFEKFPFQQGQELALRWQIPRSISKIHAGKFVLSCIEEMTEITKRGNDRHCKTIHDAIWQGTWSLPLDTSLRSGDELRLKCIIPTELPPTHLAFAPVVFWELEVQLSLSGPDFTARYLIPIY
jgi:hypothetical protein